MTPLDQSYREIPLSQDKVALVSAHRYEYLSQFKWTAFHTKGKWYAVRHTSTRGGHKPRVILMHREILGDAVKGKHGDHINGNGLDNRDENIRVASVSQNQMNRFSSDSRGIRKSGERWSARIKLDGREIHLGLFDSEHDARIAYSVAARLLHGEFRHSSVLDPSQISAGLVLDDQQAAELSKPGFRFPSGDYLIGEPLK
jgi:hypothetical protein